MERKKLPPQKEKEVVIKIEKKGRQEMMEDHLLTLILQAQNPKEAVASTSNILTLVELSTPSARAIFNTLKEYFITSEELSVAEVNKMLPTEVASSFDMYFLNPIPQFEDEDAHIREVEKVAKSVKQSAVKEQLGLLSEKMKEAEKKGNEEELQEIRVEFNNLALRFK